MAKRTLRFFATSALDIADAVAWYEGQQEGLGNQFFEEIQACLKRIEQFPEAWPVAFGSFRRALLKPFRYAVFYRVTDTEILVYSVFHTSRDIDELRKRLLSDEPDQ